MAEPEKLRRRLEAAAANLDEAASDLSLAGMTHLASRIRSVLAEVEDSVADAA
jgi:hypothetical protein